ncbi:unknown protein [Desulfotalea psychrophila LSv54]|uniref:Uncharacterized protein n=1 Tax=Desulfotalea psychrophila (strain LSv54 / DSM 12343) TaxID=177439 RepID=Q6AQS8_DESPS|nr:unknown protein [Desulfotalea psychrophila LSv54]
MPSYQRSAISCQHCRWMMGIGEKMSSTGDVRRDLQIVLLLISLWYPFFIVIICNYSLT